MEKTKIATVGLILITEQASDSTVERAVRKAMVALHGRGDTSESNVTEHVEYKPTDPFPKNRLFRPETVGEALDNVEIHKQASFKPWKYYKSILRDLRKMEEVRQISLSHGPHVIEQMVSRFLKRNSVNSIPNHITILRLVFDNLFPGIYTRISRVRITLDRPFEPRFLSGEEQPAYTPSFLRK
ncbi:MAG: hypothetical protein OXF02_07480 [Simkaniaceae bacterium]|nr:hypothetical protein [Simkaniaceae bacterium]